ncbi:MAG: 3-oxoacyl-ACP synthase [Acidimicrobiia bacterium]|nr:3-oxoacyl-ACP synthase [Acidimicrobiia bacterium]
MGNHIIGTGMHVPANVVTNKDLARIMDTDDDWIVARTGIRERRFVDEGQGASDLAIAAGIEALEDADVSPADVDVVVTATMTPDYVAPGIAGLVQAGLGLGDVPTFDLRQQCSGFLFALDLADAWLTSGRGATALIIGAEVHAGFQPWSRESWLEVLGQGSGDLAEPDYQVNTAHRAWSVLFGDGAGAMVLRRGEDPDSGVLASSLHTDGRSFELIWVPGVGFRSRPYVSAARIEEASHLPQMDGAGLFRKAVKMMPEATRTAARTAGLDIDDIDLVVAHQANDRILQGVRRELGMGAEQVPSNIETYGNTTSGTIPILYHELRSAGKVPPGSVVAFTAFGAGAHYGAVIYREP